MGLQEHSQGEACWWTVHPASKQRSEGEKVRVGDDLILVSVATERYLVRCFGHKNQVDQNSFCDYKICAFLNRVAHHQRK